MATLYFAATTSGAWNTLSNWWQDIAFTIPATALPAAGDTVYIEGSLATGPTTAITLGTLYVAQINSGASIANVGAGISTTGDLIVGKSTYLSGSIGIYGTSVSMTVGGACYFYASSYNYASLTVSLANFYNSSFNYSSGHLSGNALFNGSTYNEGSVQANATFNDNSYNLYGTVSGNAIFNDESENYYDGTVDGNATFNDKSSNDGLISGNATVNYAPDTSRRETHAPSSRRRNDCRGPAPALARSLRCFPNTSWFAERATPIVGSPLDCDKPPFDLARLTPTLHKSHYYKPCFDVA